MATPTMAVELHTPVPKSNGQGVESIDPQFVDSREIDEDGRPPATLMEQFPVNGVEQSNTNNGDQLTLNEVHHTAIPEVEQPSSVEVEQPSSAEMEQFPAGGDELNIANAEQLSVDGTEQLPVNDDEHTLVSDAERPSSSGDVQLLTNEVEHLTINDAEQLSTNDVQQLPVSDVQQVPTGEIQQAPVREVEQTSTNEPEQISTNDFDQPYTEEVEKISINGIEPLLVDGVEQLSMNSLEHVSINNVEQPLANGVHPPPNSYDSVLDNITEAPGNRSIIEPNNSNLNGAQVNGNSALEDRSGQIPNGIDPKTGVDSFTYSNGVEMPLTNGWKSPHLNGYSNTDGHNEVNGVNGVENHDEAPAVPEDSIMPIAIIGMSCRFPGDATNPSKLWDLIAAGKGAWTPIPKDKFNADAFYHPDPDRHGTMNVKGGYFLNEDISYFDAPFFNISQNEAKAMDPQQRLQLESAYEALENAGLPIEKVSGSETGVYVGVLQKDYADLDRRDPEVGALYLATGTGPAMLSNRISYSFNLKGPSITIDTACSASLVALHLACQSLRTGETKQAIIGGTNMIINPDIMISMSLLGFLSPDGKSYTYDHRANGYARGEGVASIVIKPLKDALRDGDPIRAVIRGTAVNSDGRTTGITLPSREAQESMIRSAYAQAGLDPKDTGYVEAHGTGTKAGDSLEAGAIADVFGQGRDKSNPIYVGSIKTNCGHLEGASGLAGIIKSVLILEHAMIPPNLNFEKANDRIPLDDWNLKIPLRLEPWPNDKPRRASVNSFGYGGTNAHVILDEVCAYLSSKQTNGALESSLSSCPSMESLSLPFESSKKIFVFAANSENTGKKMMNHISHYLKSQTVPQSYDILEKLAFTLAQRRSMLPWKSTVTASSLQELITNLEGGNSRFIRSSRAPKLGFVFTGQGAQWAGMGRELFGAYEVFDETLQRAEKHLQKLGAPWLLAEELFRNQKASRINEPALSQPLCTAIQIALVDLLSSWNIRPTAVTGHSSGEIAAAYAAGYLSLESAMTSAYFRGLLSSGVAGASSGGMIAVGLSEDNAEPYISRVSSGHLVVACVNSPTSVTVSGDLSAIDEIQSMLDAEGIFNRKLKVGVAYHSHHMKAIAAEYLESVKDVKVQSADGTQFYSSVSGSLSDGSELGAEYWVKNMVSPVLFSKSLRNMCIGQSNASKRRTRNRKLNLDFLIEVGPHSALAGPVKQILAAQEFKDYQVPYASCLVRNTNAIDSVLGVASTVFMHGYPVDFDVVNLVPTIGDSLSRVLPDIPPYPWNHSTRYWHESRLNKDYRLRPFPRLDLLGAPAPNFNPIEPDWRGFLRVAEIPWAKDHQVQGSILYPGAGMMIMAIEAMRQVAISKKLSVDGYTLRDISIGKALVIPDTADGIETKFTLRPLNVSSLESSEKWQEFRVFTVTGQEDWTEHCRGCISFSINLEPGEVDNGRESTLEKASIKQMFADHDAACRDPIDIKEMYDGLESIGLCYGPSFQNVQKMRGHGNKSIAVVSISNTASLMPHNFEFPHLLHPATLDATLHTIFPALTSGGKDLANPLVPTFIKHMFVSNKISSTPGHLFKIASSASWSGFRYTEASITVADNDDSSCQAMIEVEGLRCSSISHEAPSDTAPDARKLAFRMMWKADVDMLKIGGEDEALCPWPHDNEQSTMISNLEAASFFYVKDAINQLSDADVENMESHYQTFHRLMKATDALAQKGEMEHQTPKWLSATKEEQQEIFALSKTYGTEGRMVCRMGENLARVMRKEIEPLSLMLEDELLFEYYGKAIGTERCYEQMVTYLTKLSHKHPDLNILEIGAGTGGATLPALKALGGFDGEYPRFAHYDFTDISSGFFEKAQEKFKPWEALMSYRKLNIEHDPREDGFEYGKYDLIIAANVLHATKSMETTMQHVKRLLKPGGKLVLMEVTHLLLRGNVIFGNLPGWWLGAHEGRINGPMLNEDQWDALLRKTGFSGLDVCLPDFPDKIDQMCSIMVSTIPTEPPRESVETVIIGDASNAGISVGGLVSLIEHLTGNKPGVCNLASLPADLSGKICIFIEELSAPILHDPRQDQFEAIRTFVSASKGVLWVTRGGAINSEVPEANLAPGLARSLRSENQTRKLITLDLDYTNPLDESNAAEAVFQLFKATFYDIGDVPNVDLEFSERNGRILIPRIVEDAPTNTFIAKETQQPVPELQAFEQADRPLKLEIGIPGLMDTLRFVDDSKIALPLGNDDVEVKVQASGLNFRDIMVAMGQIVSDFLGCECSGIVTKLGRNVTHVKVGDRICTWTLGAYSTHLRNPGVLIQPIPDDMSFEEAASLPVVYCTAYLGLITTAHLQKGESVLIHAAAGGVGQAAIMLSKMIGAEIFVTVGTLEKKKFIMDVYGIPEDHIFSSRDTSFAQGILRVTEGKGVDVVLNSLAGELLRETWNCIALFGRFVEIGKRDMEINTKLDMAPFKRNVAFASVDLMLIFSHRQTLGATVFAEVMKLLREKTVGHITPLTVYPVSEIESAFRLMQAGKHLGKVVLKHTHDAVVKVILRNAKPLKFREDVSYLLIGGLGGLGRAVSTWMVENGARHLIFVSRSGAASEKAQEFVSSLERSGVNVAVQKCDVGDLTQLTFALEESKQRMPPIRGVIHGGMVLKDSIFESMPYEYFQETLRPKIKGTKNLHQYFEKSELDFFVILSSSGGIIGNASQSNYAASSTFQDAFAHFRTAKGLPVVSLDLGAIAEVGFIAENADYVGNLERWGYLTITGAEFLAIVKSAIVNPTRSHEDCQVITGLGTQGMVESMPGASASDPPFWFSDAKFSHLLQLDKAVNKEETHEGVVRLQNAIPAADSLNEASQIICDAIIAKLSKMLVLPVENIDATLSMAAYGVDSLVAVELRNWLAREAKADVPIFELLGKHSLQALSGEVALKSKLLPVALLKQAELEQN